MYAKNYPFTIDKVAGILALNVRGSSQSSLDVDCPFCSPSNHHKGKMNLNKLLNVYRCNYCDKSGGMLRLYAEVHGTSFSDAYNSICELLGCGETAPSDPSKSYDSYSKKQFVTEHRADDSTLNRTYSMLLSLLSLNNSHKEQLLKRGLSQESITRYGYKSVPSSGQTALCSKLIGLGCNLEGVPGFYRNNGVWSIKLKAGGFLIPVRGISGNIQGFQIRLDRPFKDKKYIWLSSRDMDGGAPSGSPIHVVGNLLSKRVFITEGPLKGDVAHCLSCYSFICVAGVNSIKKLDVILTQLKALGVVDVIEAFDSNKNTNEHVILATQKLKSKLLSFGLKVRSFDWNPAFMGIDDYFLHLWQNKNAARVLREAG